MVDQGKWLIEFESKLTGIVVLHLSEISGAYTRIKSS